MLRAIQRAAPWVVLAWLPMLWWYAALRPGLMSADSLTTWRQATQGGWVDLQPPLYTAAMWVSDLVAGGPGLLTLAQSLLLAASIVAVGRAQVRLGVDRRVATVVCAIVACTPMVGAFSVSLWKDIPFTAALLFVTARLVDAVDGRVEVRPIVAWSVTAVLLRQNGVVVVGLIFVVLWLVLRRHRRQLALGLSACVGALLMAKVVVYPILSVRGGPPHSEVSTFAHDIASVAGRDPGALDGEDRALLERVAPVATWGEAWRSFQCHSANWQYRPDFDWTGIEGHQREIVALWVELLVEHPRAILGNRLCVGAVAWRPDGHGVLFTVSRGIDQNELGLQTAPIVGAWRNAAVEVLDALDDSSVQRYAWRAPGWLYLTYAVVGATAWRRRRPALLLPLVPAAALQLAVAALNPAQDARYMMPGLISAWLLVPVATLPTKWDTDEPGTSQVRGAEAAPPLGVRPHPVDTGSRAV